MLIKEIKEIIDQTGLSDEDILKYTIAILSKEVTNLTSVETASNTDYRLLIDLVSNNENVICAITRALVDYASILL